MSEKADLNYVTVYTCDVCKSANFKSLEEAEIHERSCTGSQSTGTKPTNNLALHAANPRDKQMRRASSSDPSSNPVAATNTAKISASSNTASSASATINSSSSVPVQPKSNSNGVVNQTLFKCKRCKILFWNESSARTHEKTCNSPPYFGCKVCNVLRFFSPLDHRAHERTCKGIRPLSRAELPLAENILGRDKDANEGASSVGRGTVGKIGASGMPIDEAGAVKQSSKPVAPKVNSNDNEDDSSVEVLSVGPVNTTSIKNLSKPTDKASAPRGTNSEKEESLCTVWTCDICNKAQFDTYEEAERHEKICEGPPKAAVVPQAPPVQPVQPRAFLPREAPAPHVILFSPILTDNSLHINREKVTFESKKDLAISDFYCEVLKCVNLAYRPGTMTVSFQCRFCCNLYPDPWSLEQLTKDLSNKVVKHLRAPSRRKQGDGCGKVPPGVLQNLLENDRTKYSTRPKFNDFMKKYFVSNGIIEKPILLAGESTNQLTVIPDDVFRKSLEFRVKGRYSIADFLLPTPESPASSAGAKKKREDVANTKSTKQKVPRSQSISPTPMLIDLPAGIECGNMGSKLHSDEHGDQFYLPPMDGIPLVSSISLKECKRLHKSYQTLLHQVELFTLFPKLSKSADEEVIPESVGIRCQNCIASQSGCCFRRISSVSGIASDIVLMGMKHLTICACTEASVQEEMRTLSMKDADHMKEYCSHISKLYSMEDRKVNNVTAAVWGKSAKVPGGYNGHPIDINFDFILGKSASVLGEDSKMPATEVGIPAAARPI